MATKQYPKLDIWAHMGARYGGRSAGEPALDVEQAMAQTIVSKAIADQRRWLDELERKL